MGVGEPVERSEDGEQSLILTLNPDTTGLNGATFTCKVTTADSGKVFEESVTIKVKGEPIIYIYILLYPAGFPSQWYVPFFT